MTSILASFVLSRNYALGQNKGTQLSEKDISEVLPNFGM